MRNIDVQRYRDFLTINGHELVNAPSDSEVIFLWTCAFRGDMRDNSLMQIKHYMDNYKIELVVAGCLPDIDREFLTSQFKGYIVNWADDEKKMEEFFGAPKKKLSEIKRILDKDKLYDNEKDFRRANPDADVPYIGRYAQIYVSEGCPFECAYCSERFAFPPYRSFPEDEIVSACRHQIDKYERKAVVLLGDSVGTYGLDIGSNLPNLIRKLAGLHPEIKIAIQGFNPYYFLKFYDSMVEFIRSGLVVHLQMPYQSASDRILRLMNRPYTRAELDKVFGTINGLGFTEFDSHIIVGFHGETEEDFEESIQFALRHRPKYVLLSRFMETPNMPTAKMSGKVSVETIKRRLNQGVERLNAAGILCNSDDSEFSKDRFKKMDIIIKNT